MLTLTPDEVLKAGLRCAGFSAERRGKLPIKLRRFKAYYGALPIVYASLVHDLQVTEDLDARVEMRGFDDFVLFLLCIHFLKCYRTEHVLAGLFKKNEKTVRK